MRRGSRESNLVLIPLTRKQVDFGSEGKVLLSRIGGQVNATSAFCTHYGAPLASKFQTETKRKSLGDSDGLSSSLEGVLESSGRVVCPWHGGSSSISK